MICVHFDPTALTGDDAAWWQAWSHRAAAARRQAISEHEAGGSHEFDRTIWSDLKEWLIRRVFHGKCAYCEAPVELTGFGDGEHFRPKGRVTLLVDGKTRVVQVDGRDHPGYYWLAYEWHNLFPACSQCNTAGKMNHFPVARQHVARHDVNRNDPEDLDALEEPLLLNPYVDDPGRHFRFIENGVVIAVDGDRRGQESIDTYKLMRGDLVTARWQAQRLVWMSCLAEANRDGGNPRQILEPYLQGRAWYSRAVVDYVAAKLRKLNEDLDPSG